MAANRKFEAVLCDIEGTTTSISFVKVSLHSFLHECYFKNQLYCCLGRFIPLLFQQC